MSSRDERFLRIVINLMNTALDYGLIDRSDPWFPNNTEPFIRISTIVDGDIPAVVDVSGWYHGVCSLRCALWPKSPDVSLDISPFSTLFPMRFGVRLMRSGTTDSFSGTRVVFTAAKAVFGAPIGLSERAPEIA